MKKCLTENFPFGLVPTSWDSWACKKCKCFVRKGKGEHEKEKTNYRKDVALLGALFSPERTMTSRRDIHLISILVRVIYGFVLVDGGNFY